MAFLSRITPLIFSLATLPGCGADDGSDNVQIQPTQRASSSTVVPEEKENNDLDIERRNPQAGAKAKGPERRNARAGQAQEGKDGQTDGAGGAETDGQPDGEQGGNGDCEDEAGGVAHGRNQTMTITNGTTVDFAFVAQTELAKN